MKRSTKLFIFVAALFLVVGVVYDRLHSHVIDRFDGLVHRMPVYAFVFMAFLLASVGLPGTSGFVGEFLVIVGVFKVNTWVALLAGLGIILGAAYMLYLYRRVIFGQMTKEDIKDFTDLSPREMAVFAPLLVVMLWMGIYPSSFLDMLHVSVEHLIRNYEMALAVGEPITVAGW